MGDAASIITAVGGVMVAMSAPIGAVVIWAAKKFDTINAQLKACEVRDTKNRDDLRKVSLGCELMMIEMPDNPALEKVRLLLQSVFPKEDDAPAGLAHLAELLDELKKRRPSE